MNPFFETIWLIFTKSWWFIVACLVIRIVKTIIETRAKLK